jgi:hypothetical protein
MSGSILYIVEDLPSCSKSPQDFVCSLGFTRWVKNTPLEYHELVHSTWERLRVSFCAHSIYVLIEVFSAFSVVVGLLYVCN